MAAASAIGGEKKSSRGGRAKNWCFTAFIIKHIPLDPKTMEGIVYKEEICPKTGKHHLQGFVCFLTRVCNFPLLCFTYFVITENVAKRQGPFGGREDQLACCSRVACKEHRLHNEGGHDCSRRACETRREFSCGDARASI